MPPNTRYLNFDRLRHTGFMSCGRQGQSLIYIALRYHECTDCLPDGLQRPQAGMQTGGPRRQGQEANGAAAVARKG